MNRKMKKLNLGCGEDYRPGFVNIDVNKNIKSDFTVDVEKGLKGFKDNTFDYIYSRHVFEHLQPRKLPFIMDEILRVCKNDAIIDIFVPHFSCGKTYQSYDHLTFMSYFTFSCNDFKNFKIIERRLSFMRSELPYTGKLWLNSLAKIVNPILSFIPNRVPFFYERFFCWIYPVEEIYFRFKVKK